MASRKLKWFPAPIRSAVAVTAALTLALSACTSDGRDSASTTEKEPTTPSTKTEGTAEQPAPPDAPDLPIPELQLERLDVDLDSPIAAIPLPRSNGLLVAERAGTVRMLDISDNTVTLSPPVIDISSEVSTDVERGLLGLALSPEHDRLFLSYTNRDGDSRLDMYQVTWPDRTGEDGSASMSVDRSSRTEMLAVKQPYANHNGGHIEFGPDRMLYYGLGDGGAGGDPQGNAQSRSTLLGKLLRLDPEGNPSDGFAAKDNPFIGEKGAKAEIWSTGLRNPWRFSFDSNNGDLWVADVGQDRFEEIDRVTQAEGGGSGANFGWDLFEGNEPFKDADPAPSPASDGPFVKPVYVYEHGPGCSVTGGVVYRGKAIPGLVGRYLFSDFCDGTIRALTLDDGGATMDDLGIEVDQAVAFAADTSGEVYVLSLSGDIHRISAEV